MLRKNRELLHDFLSTDKDDKDVSYTLPPPKKKNKNLRVTQSLNLIGTLLNECHTIRLNKLASYYSNQRRFKIKYLSAWDESHWLQRHLLLPINKIRIFKWKKKLDLCKISSTRLSKKNIWQNREDIWHKCQLLWYFLLNITMTFNIDVCIKYKKKVSDTEQLILLNDFLIVNTIYCTETHFIPPLHFLTSLLDASWNFWWDFLDRNINFDTIL